MAGLLQEPFLGAGKGPVEAGIRPKPDLVGVARQLEGSNIAELLALKQCLEKICISIARLGFEAPSQSLIRHPNHGGIWEGRSYQA